MLDILAFASKELEDSNPVTQSKRVGDFAMRNARDILNFSGRNPWNDLSYKARFSELLDLLSETSAHRVAITNEQIDVIGLITQSRIIRFFFNNKDKFQDRVNRTVEQAFGKIEKPVLTVHLNEFVINALKKMKENRVSGLAIVDDKGKLVGNISAGDLKVKVFFFSYVLLFVYFKNSTKNMDTSTLEGLREDLHSQIRSFKGIVSDSRMLSNLSHFDPITVSRTSSLLEIMEKVLKYRIHRVYVTDSEGKPIQIISLGDLIKVLK